MKIQSVLKSKRFIPDFNGNKEQPAGDQIVITFNRIPGTAEKETFLNMKFDGSGNVTFIHNDSAFCGLIDRIENLVIVNPLTGDEMKIVNGTELLKANCEGLIDLFTEIRDYIYPKKVIEEKELNA